MNQCVYLRTVLALNLAVGALLAPGCTSTVMFSCDVINQQSHFCIDFIGEGAQPEVCDSMQGEYQGGACTATNLVGSCAMMEGTPGEMVERYYSDGPTLMTPAQAQEACQMTGGRFIAAPAGDGGSD